MFQLTAIDEGGGTLVFPLLSPRARIGADEDNDVVLRSPEVAARHAVLHLSGEAVRVEDLATRGGTFVDHVRARGDEPLAPGTAIGIGPHRLLLESFHAPDGTEGATIVVGARSLGAFARVAGDLARVVVDGQDAHDATPAPVDVGGRFVTPPTRRIAVAAHPWIKVLTGPEAGQRFFVDSENFVIGRGDGCDLCLSDPDVRPDHCAIRREGQGYALHDHAGDGRTFVNGAAVRRVRLTTEDRVRVGGTELLFRGRPMGKGKPGVVRPPACDDAPTVAEYAGEHIASGEVDWIWKAASGVVVLMGLAGIAGYLLVPELRRALEHVLR
jgi:pSer/pThr/pTyr-binding forkhead associated (FHA) protein